MNLNTFFLLQDVNYSCNNCRAPSSELMKNSLSKRTKAMAQAESLLARCLKGVRDNTKVAKRPANTGENSKVQDATVTQKTPITPVV